LREVLKFLVDECAGPFLAQWLSSKGHDVFSIFASARGADDDWILDKAFAEKRVLITNDKGFGEKIFRSRVPHEGVVLLRLADETPAAKVEVFSRLLDSFSGELEGAYVVATERKVRIVKK
jgi:predicted nuclease of predicted toxin-antitoxin system